MTKVVVAIDGPAGAGKSTVAKRLARALGYRLLDTGAIYRSVALLARRTGVAWSDEAALAAIAAGLDIRFELIGEDNRVFLGQEDVSAAIRTPAMAMVASRVSAVPMVREKLTELQRAIGAHGGIPVVYPAAPDNLGKLTAAIEATAMIATTPPSIPGSRGDTL